MNEWYDTAYEYDEDGVGTLVRIERVIDWESFDAEILLHTLSQIELELVLFRSLGYKPKEIVTIMGLSSINRYYGLKSETKRGLLIKKHLINSYNT